MMYAISHEDFGPRFYKPKEDNVIFANHVTLFFECQHAHMMRGHLSAEDAWLTLELLYHIGMCVC